MLDEHDEKVWKRYQRTDLEGQLRHKWNSPQTRLRQGETLGMPTESSGFKGLLEKAKSLARRWQTE